MSTIATVRKGAQDVDIEAARQVIVQEAEALRALEESIDASISEAVNIILDATPYVVVTGVGKSGHIGAKIASTFASTGTPSFFLHPAEASHGDLGMIAPGCAVVAISNSGESRELLDVLKYSRRQGNPVIGFTSNGGSSLARSATVTLTLPRVPEACINGLAPTTSTTCTLALGDALAVAVMKRRGFTSEEFGMRHPGGKLGLRLQTVSEWLFSQDRDAFLDQDEEAVPTISADAAIDEVVENMARGRKGCTGVIDGDGKLIGMITDGDLRRAIAGGFLDKSARALMMQDPISLTPDMKLSDVVQLFAERRISNAFVVDEMRPIGVVHIKDLMAAGVL